MSQKNSQQIQRFCQTNPQILKKKQSGRDRTKEQKNIAFLSRLDLGLHTWFPDTEEAQQHQTEV